MTTGLLYLYGFVPDDGPDPTDLVGIGDAPVRRVDLGGVTAVVADVAAAEFSAEALEARMHDLAWVGDQGAMHERVVTWFVDHGGILPARLLTLYSGQRSLASAVAPRKDRIRDELERLRGLREWDLKVSYRAEELRRGIGSVSDAVAQLDRDIAAADPGRRYLLDRKREKLLETETGRVARRLGDEALDALAELVREVRRIAGPTDRDDLPVVVHAALLVEEGQEAALQERTGGELGVQFSRSRVAERAARQESDRLSVVLTNMGDPILVTDAASNIILMNSRAERLFETDVARDEQFARIVQANHTKFTTLISDFLLQAEDRRVENLILQDPESTEELPVEVVSSKISDPRGQVTAIVSLLHDLSAVVENERLARELQVLNEGLEERIRLATEELEERNRRLEFQSRELQKASRLKSEFLASMSHELRTPINAMLGYTALLREEIYGELNDKQESALRKIYGASQHLLALINDILDLSKIEAGKMPVRIESVRLETVVSELSQTIEPMVREKKLEYRTVVSENLPAMETDRTKVKQILLNLLSNAVKFTAEGQVIVRALPLEGGRTVRIEVQDTGIGIKPEDREAIFDDFRQVDQSSTRKYGGTGLGLSITRKLVRLMGGTIQVDSEFGKGSTFRVDLPAIVAASHGDSGSELDVPLQDIVGM